MLKKNKLRLGVATTALAVTALTGITAVPAFADPSVPGSANPVFRTLSGVGSDTIQDVMNGMGSVIPAIGSYDAVEPVTSSTTSSIITKSGGNSFLRPNGSGAGVQALSYSLEGKAHPYNSVDITGEVDFARSSSGPGFTGTDLTYIPFAQDAVSYAVNAGSDFPRNLPLGSVTDAKTRLSLYNIYNCNVSSYTDSNGNSVTIHPLLPQSKSGTAKFWATTMGYSDTTVPSCVKRVNTDTSAVTIEEHNGTSLDNAGDIVPFSIAQYIAQGNHASIFTNYTVSVLERRGNIDLGAINGYPALVESGTATLMNPNFPVTRQVFNVVSSASLNGQTANSTIVSTFAGTSSGVCSQSALIQNFGFSTISNCGDTILTAGYTP